MTCSPSYSTMVGVVLVFPPFQVDLFENAAELGEDVGTADAEPLLRCDEGDVGKGEMTGAVGAYISDNMLSSRGDVSGENSWRILSDCVCTDSQAAIRTARRGSDAGVATRLGESQRAKMTGRRVIDKQALTTGLQIQAP